MGYWGGVAKRAVTRAAKDLRLDSVVAVVLGLLIQALIGLLLFFALGNTDANIWTRIATGLAPFLMFPVAFAIRMATEPAAMARESQARIAALEAEANGPAKKRAFYRSQLQVLYQNTGAHLRAVMGITQDDKLPLVATELETLYQNAVDWLRANMGEAAVQKYLAPGVGAYSYEWPGQHSHEACRTRDNMLDTLKARQKNLEDLLGSDRWDPT